MIRYTVVWEQDAQGDLADVWLQPGDRAAVTAAAEAIDRDLAVDASAKGIELSEGLRAYHAPPIRVLFLVRENDRIVEVLCVKPL